MTKDMKAYIYIPNVANVEVYLTKEVVEHLKSIGVEDPILDIQDAIYKSFDVEASNQSLAVAQSPWAEEDQAAIDAISEEKPLTKP